MYQHPRRRLYLRPFFGWSKRLASWLAVYSLPLYVLRLAHLDHAKLVTSHVALRDDLDDLGAGEPAVGKHIVEVNLTLDDATDQLYHQRYLALVVLRYAFGGMRVLVVLLGEACVKLLLLQAMIAPSFQPRRRWQSQEVSGRRHR